jgi:hypothetical protein
LCWIEDFDAEVSGVVAAMVVVSEDAGALAAGAVAAAGAAALVAGAVTTGGVGVLVDGSDAAGWFVAMGGLETGAFVAAVSSALRRTDEQIDSRTIRRVVERIGCRFGSGFMKAGDGCLN